MTKIIHYIRDPKEQEEELEGIVRKFRTLVKRKIITPELFPEDLDVEYFQSHRSIIIEDEDEIINGILTYSLFSLAQLQQPTIQSLISNSFHNIHGKAIERVNFSVVPGFGDNLSDIYAFVEDMESFKKGTGRELLNEVRAESIQGIILQSLGKAQGFYRKMGFVETGLYGNSTLSLPILAWRE